MAADDVAGMQVVLGAEYDQLDKGFAHATAVMAKFREDTLNLAKIRIAPNINLDKLNDFTKSVGTLQGKAVKIFTEVTGIDQVIKASEAVKNLKSKTVNVNINAKGADKLTQVDLAIKALQQTGGVVLDVQTTDVTQLLATLKQVQALGRGKSVLQVTASGKGIEGLNNALKNAATAANLAELALKSFQEAANTTMQFLAAQNGSLAAFLTSVSGISAQATQQTVQLTQAMQGASGSMEGLSSSASNAANAAENISTAAQQAGNAAENIAAGFTAASAQVNTYVAENGALSNSIVQNVQILNQYRARMQEVSREIAALAKMEGLSASEAAANQRAINVLGSEYARLKQQASQATSTINAQSKAAISAEGSYNDLQQQLTLVNQAIRRLSQTDLSGAIGKGMIKQSADIQKALSDIDTQMGIHVRNVGNYSGATNYLNQTMAQLSGEIPNFFQSMKMGFMSISNNIQPVIVALQNLRVENARLAASGEPTKSAFKTVASAFFGWQTLLFVGVGLLSRYGSNLVDLISDISSGKTEADKLADAIKKANDEFYSGEKITKRYVEALQSINTTSIESTKNAGAQIAKLQELYTTMTNTNNAIDVRKNAYDKIIAIYPQLNGFIDEEKSLSGGLAVVINTQLIPALMKRAAVEGVQSAIVKAYETKADAIANEVLLTNKSAEAHKKAGEALKAYNESWRSSNFQGMVGKWWDMVKAQQAANRSSTAVLSNSSALADVTKMIPSLMDQLTQSMNDLSGSMLGTVSPLTQLQDHLKALEAQQGQMHKGDAGWDALKVKIDATKKAIQEYGPSHKEAKKHVDALTKSENTLQAALKQIDTQLKSGQITALEAARQKLQAYQKDLTTLFQNKGSKIKIAFDLGKVTDLRKQVHDEIVKAALNKYNETIVFDAQLNAAGLIDPLEQVNKDLAAAQERLTTLTTGKNALPIDDKEVIKVQDEIKKGIALKKDLTKKKKIDLAVKAGTEGMASIEEDLKNGWITPLEAAKAKVKNLETELKALQKAGESASVIIPVKIQLANEKQDLAVKEVQEIINKTFAKSDARSITAKVNLGFELTTNLQEAQQKLRADSKALRDTMTQLMEQLPDGAKEALNRGLSTAFRPEDIAELIQKSIASLPENLRRVFQDAFGKAFENLKADEAASKMAEFIDNVNKTVRQMAIDGLVGVGEIIGTAIAGGDVDNLFKGLMQNVGAQLEELGKWMITTAIKFDVIKKAFENAMKFNPILGVVAGVATIALGAALKAAFSKKQSQMKFADGGIVYGRTNAIIGEYQGARNNPEVVAPLNKLKSILKMEGGGGIMDVNIHGVIDNDVIRLASDRSDIKSRR